MTIYLNKTVLLYGTHPYLGIGKVYKINKQINK